MSPEHIERAARTELSDSLYQHAAGLKSLAMQPLLLQPKYAAIREGLEHACGKLMHLQSDIGYLPFDSDSE
jgi:hypothetical protein